jgi:HEAT repeats
VNRPPAKLVADLRALLDGLTAAPWPYRRGVLTPTGRKARRLCTDGWLTALDRAIDRSKTRKRAGCWLLAELIDRPEVLERFNAWLHDPDREWRAEVIQFVGNRGLGQFAAALNDALDPRGDGLCRAYAISVAGRLRSEENLPAVLRLANDRAHVDLFRRTLWALKDYAHPACRPTLRRWFQEARSKEVKVLAAWGLGKLGDRRAIEYLGDMLDDPDREKPGRYFDPGQSWRAAQALCDVHGWPFQWDQRLVERTRRCWRRAKQGG